MLNINRKFNINQLRNKKSNGEQIIYFEYTILNDDDNEITFRYYKISDLVWRIEMVTQPHEEMPFRLFSETFSLPNSSVPLTVVCGIGLLAIKEVLSIEVQYYSTLQFTILNEVEKMR